jgi:hypothetical protein
MGANYENNSRLSLCIKTERFPDRLSKDRLLKEGPRLQRLLQIRYFRNKPYLFPGIRGIFCGLQVQEGKCAKAGLCVL